MTIDKNALLARTATRFHEFELPGGGAARIRSLTDRERSQYEVEALDGKGDLSKSRLARQKRKLIALCLVDNDDRRLFEDGESEELASVDGAVTGIIYQECKKHCGFEEGDIESLSGNSNATAG